MDFENLIPGVSAFKLGAGALALVALLITGWGIYHRIDQGGYDRKATEVVVQDNKALKQDAQIRKKQNEILNADITPTAFGNILLEHRY